MINLQQFHDYVVAPTLYHIGLHTKASAQLLLSTSVVESRLRYLKQVRGPACGVFQVEPATHDDIMKNYLAHHEELTEKVLMLVSSRAIVEHRSGGGLSVLSQEMCHNMRYNCAIARLVYYRKPQRLPDAGDWPEMAAYWKQHYNTPLGAGTVERFILDVDTFGLSEIKY